MATLTLLLKLFCTKSQRSKIVYSWKLYFRFLCHFLTLYLLSTIVSCCCSVCAMRFFFLFLRTKVFLHTVGKIREISAIFKWVKKKIHLTPYINILIVWGSVITLIMSEYLPGNVLTACEFAKQSLRFLKEIRLEPLFYFILFSTVQLLNCVAHLISPAFRRSLHLEIWLFHPL